ncbi:MAG: hypothetical protein A2Y94_11430 [Caldithrix sp. RBG_13_44_9]|nr:MAG: hypothetical protein A2Y94_11430 [Caldithrix sp. RBG_13_44_9]
MIKIFLRSGDTKMQEIQKILQEMVITHQIILLSDQQNSISENSNWQELPALEDSGTIIQGQQNILNYLEQLQSFKKEWDKFQSDSCYCDAEGNI